MRKTIITTIVIPIIISILFSGCFSKTEQETAYIKSKIISKPIPKTITIKQKDTFTINLEANITTGFSWEVEIIDGDIIRLIDEDYITDQDKNIDLQSIVVGSGGVKIYTFEALNPGKTKLKLNYAQRWQGGADGEKITTTIIVK